MWQYLFLFILFAFMLFVKFPGNDKFSSIALYPFVFALAIIELLIIRFIVELIQPNDFPFIVNISIYSLIVFSLLIYIFVKKWNRWIIIFVAIFATIIDSYIVIQLLEFFKEGSIIRNVHNVCISSVKHINSSSLSAIATLITAILILLTLYEYRTQRKSSYLPKLILGSSTNLNVWWKKITNIQGLFFPINWTKDVHESSKIDIYTPAHSLSDGLNYKIICHNIGNGSANSVKISWSFNLKKMIGAINFKKDNFGFKVKNNKPANTIDITRPDKIVETQPIGAEMIFDKILKNNSVEIEFPKGYLLLSSILIYQNNAELEKNQKKSLFDRIKEFLYFQGDGFSLFPLELKITYSDLENNKKEQFHLINIDFDELHYGENKSVMSLRSFSERAMMFLPKKKQWYKT